MDEFKRPLTDRDLIRALLNWHADELSDDELRSRVDRYIDTLESRGSSAPTKNLVSSSKANSLSEKRALVPTSMVDIPARQSDEFLPYENVPYEPLADVVDEPRGAWIPDGWGMYYALDDFLYRVSFGFVTILNLTILVGFFVILGVAFSAWQISMSAERQKRPQFKSMTNSPEKTTEKERKSVLPELTTSVTSAATNSVDSPFTESDVAIENSVPAIETNKATPFDKAMKLIDQADLPTAMLELQAIEDLQQPENQPVASMLKIEVLMRQRTSESMELARQSLMDCKFGEQQLNFDLLVTRWMLTCSGEDRQRFVREAASLPAESRKRMVNWAKVRSGSGNALLESELESNAPRSPNGLCDLLFLASYQYSAGKGDQTMRNLLDVQQKLRSLSTRELDRAEAWLLESSRSNLIEKVDEIVAAINRKQIN